MEVTHYPVRGRKGGVKVVKNSVKVALQESTEFIKVAFCNVTVRTAIGFAVRDALERESIEFFLGFKEVGIYGVGILRGREEFPTRGSGEENLHVLV